MPASQAAQSAKVIREHAGDFQATIAIVLGSGLGGFADHLKDPIHISYSDLPGFPINQVKSHAGILSIGKLNGNTVVCLQGRPHYYEGTDAETFKTFVRTMKLIGCDILLATNASGSLVENIKPGDLALIKDHINFQGVNPLAGPDEVTFGERFFPMDDAYDPELRTRLLTSAKNLSLALHEGVYISVLGPNFETAAEIQAFKTLGADIIGMSTVPEVLIARHCGLRVAGIATITNFATGLTNVPHSHDAVIETAHLASEKLSKLIIHFCGNLHNANQ